jgi:hypothetical protein
MTALNCVFSSWSFPMHTKRLGQPAVRSINGKHDDKYSEPNHDM